MRRMNNSNKKVFLYKQYPNDRYLLNKHKIIQIKLENLIDPSKRKYYDKVSNKLPTLTLFSSMFHFYALWKRQKIGDSCINQLIEILILYIEALIMVMRLDAYSLIYQNHLKRCDISVKLLCNFMKLIKRFRKNTKS